MDEHEERQQILGLAGTIGMQAAARVIGICDLLG